jgi:hypothetical protein
MIRKLLAVAMLTAALLMSGCATSRSEIKLHSPAVVAPPATATSARVVVIGAITDERIFEQAPNDPSTPSLGFGGANKATDDIKARAIGRKRNSYGMALGDVLLQQGQTVTDVIRENLVAAFQQAGYQVKSKDDAGLSPLVVDVHIKQFWAWFTPGFWAVTLSGNVATDLVIDGGATPVVVSAHVEDKHAAATENGWMQIIEKGLDAYRAEIVKRIQNGDGINVPARVASGASVSSSVEPATSPDTHEAVRSTSVAPTLSQGPGTAPVIETAPKPAPVTEAKAQAVTPPSSPSASVASGLASATATSPQDSAATAAITPIAQSVASQLGCGAVQANDATTFIAPCGTYSVLIDCDGGQCRPMHTVNVKHDE